MSSRREKDIKEKRILVAGLSLALAFSGCLPLQAQEEPSITYEQYISGEYQQGTDMVQYETIRITSVEELQELAAA
ncbi:MAG: hypothetical protein K2H45_00090, partial [Acetatifactor sp.]|nr:hypothetical protein [Acetatifactor sp.]